MFLRSLCSALLLLMLCTSGSAQTRTERAKQRAENRANNRVDQKIDQSVDKAFNAVEGLFSKKKKKRNNSSNSNDSTRQNTNYDERVEDGGLAPNNGEEYDSDEEVSNALSNLFGGGDFEPYTNERSFSLEMHITQTNRRGKQEDMEMHLAIAPTKIGQRIINKEEGERGTTRSIFDTQTGKVTMITTTKQGTEGVRMRMPNVSGMVDQSDIDEAVAGISIEETGQTRTIDGYNCRKVIARDGEGNVTESWVTREVDVRPEELYRAMTAMFGGGGKQAGGFTPNYPNPDGFPILSVVTDKKGETTELRYKNIQLGESNLDDSIFDTRGITIQEVPGF